MLFPFPHQPWFLSCYYRCKTGMFTGTCLLTCLAELSFPFHARCDVCRTWTVAPTESNSGLILNSAQKIFTADTDKHFSNVSLCQKSRLLWPLGGAPLGFALSPTLFCSFFDSNLSTNVVLCSEWGTQTAADESRQLGPSSKECNNIWNV